MADPAAVTTTLGVKLFPNFHGGQTEEDLSATASVAPACPLLLFKRNNATNTTQSQQTESSEDNSADSLDEDEEVGLPDTDADSSQTLEETDFRAVLEPKNDFSSPSVSVTGAELTMFACLRGNGAECKILSFHDLAIYQPVVAAESTLSRKALEQKLFPLPPKTLMRVVGEFVHHPSSN